jgi:hypothetical protein
MQPLKLIPVHLPQYQVLECTRRDGLVRVALIFQLSRRCGRSIVNLFYVGKLLRFEFLFHLL